MKPPKRWYLLIPHPCHQSGSSRAFTIHHSIPSLHFELEGVEGGLQQMDGAVVGVDDELAVEPVRVFVSADQKLQGELFEDVIVGGLEFVIGKRAEDGAWFGDVCGGPRFLDRKRRHP